MEGAGSFVHVHVHVQYMYLYMYMYHAYYEAYSLIGQCEVLYFTYMYVY